MTVDEVLDQAADVLEEVGWVTGQDEKFSMTRDDNKSTCITVAVQWTLPRGGGFTTRLQRETFNQIRKTLELPGARSLSDWNDHICTDQEEAVGVLRKAAEEFRAQA